jgi:hypothetical protein
VVRAAPARLEDWVCGCGGPKRVWDRAVIVNTVLCGAVVLDTAGSRTR